MALNNNRVAKDFGFGNVQNQRVRMLNKDGSFNVVRKGLPFKASFNFYHLLLNLPWAKFVFLIVAWFTFVNLAFAFVYMWLGAENLQGIDMHSFRNQFLDSFFFSTQTFTTVGYGRISPIGVSANIISSLEALVGLMSFALITGLLYGRFSMPESRLLFSENAVVAPYKEMKAIMFRIANLQKSQLLNVEVSVSVSLFEVVNGERIRSFYTLNLERNTLLFFPTSWTVVHPIDEKSPFFELNEKEFKASETELLIVFKAFDDKYLQTIHATYSYVLNEIEWGAKFNSILSVEEGWPVIDFAAMNDYSKVKL
ncbi:MAG: ion channel [Bacteroidetes bacterium]|nr:ion channel [Bacteroidota bacterium]